MNDYPRAEVFVTLLSTEAGGRTRPVNLNDHGYRPHFRVAPDSEYLGVEFVNGPEVVRPGDHAYASVRFLYSPTVPYDDLRVGRTFEILEGARVIGHGTVVRR